MNIPDELFETNHRVEITYDKPNNFWRINTSNGFGRGTTLDEAFQVLKENERRTCLQKRLDKFLATISDTQLDALNYFLDNNG